MSLGSFIVGGIIGAIFVSTIPTTARLIEKVTPFIIQGIQIMGQIISFIGNYLN